jgi:hypothetical protein
MAGFDFSLPSVNSLAFGPNTFSPPEQPEPPTAAMPLAATPPVASPLPTASTAPAGDAPAAPAPRYDQLAIGQAPGLLANYAMRETVGGWTGLWDRYVSPYLSQAFGASEGAAAAASEGATASEGAAAASDGAAAGMTGAGAASSMLSFYLMAVSAYQAANPEEYAVGLSQGVDFFPGNTEGDQQARVLSEWLGGDTWNPYEGWTDNAPNEALRGLLATAETDGYTLPDYAYWTETGEPDIGPAEHLLLSAAHGNGRYTMPNGNDSGTPSDDSGTPSDDSGMPSLQNSDPIGQYSYSSHNTDSPFGEVFIYGNGLMPGMGDAVTEAIGRIDQVVASLLSPEQVEAVKQGLYGASLQSDTWHADQGDKANTSVTDLLNARLERIGQILGTDIAELLASSAASVAASTAAVMENAGEAAPVAYETPDLLGAFRRN